MNDKIFIDSNIWLYLFDKDVQKKTTVAKLLHQNHVISTQVLSENMNVCIRKFKLPSEALKIHISKLVNHCEVMNISFTTIQLALDIHHRYGYSYYDSQIIASALENQCTILYSEDLQHGHHLDDQLKIVNPFQ